MTAQSGERFGNWAAVLESLWPDNADPLGVWTLLETSAEALRSGDGDPAAAAAGVGEALEQARQRRAADAGALEALLQRWMEGLEALQAAAPLAAGNAPALGPFARRQALLQALPRRVHAYQLALFRHLDTVAGLAGECVAAYRAALDEAPGDADPLTLARLWCRTAEPRYERWLARDDTQADIAALLNRWGELAECLRTLTDDALEALGLPSGRALDDLAAELQRQRRRQRREIASLREEIAALRRAIGPDPEGP